MISQHPFVSAAGLLPQEGDLVLAPGSRPGVGWNLGRFRGPAEIAAPSREEAIGIACAVASELAVDVWSLENRTFCRVEIHRPSARVISG
jgi:hypothetical protein